MRHLRAALVLGLALLGFAASAQAQPPATSIRPSFTALDANRDGRLSLDEVLAHATKQGVHATKQGAAFKVSDVDRNGDGVLSPEELRAAGLEALLPYGSIDLKDLDADGDGQVTQREINDYIRRRTEDAFRRADLDGDGRLSPKEFAIFRF